MEFGVGSIVEGKVTGITKFGAFVALPDGKSGLVHISEIAYSYVNEVSDFLQEGQQVKVKVIGIDESNRINLSIKKTMDPPSRPAGHQGGFHSANNRSGGTHASNGAGTRNGGSSRSHSGSYAPRSAQSKEPASFEDKLKQFMQSSDSKLSELRYMEKKGSSRRGNGRR